MTTRWLHGRSPNEPIARCGLGATIVILAVLPGLFCAARALPQVNRPAREGPALARASPRTTSSEEYVGSAACSRCHADIYSTFARTAMGHSMAPATSQSLKSLPLADGFYDQKLDRHFTVEFKDGKLYQSEYQIDDAGKEVFRATHPIDWIIGANANGLGGLIQHDDYLFEAPLTHYAQSGKWELSPGYQRADNGFNRVISPGCIFCHSGRVQPVTGVIGKYETPIFTQVSIGCENCHGPGAAHVRAMGDGISYARDHDPTIVNPASLKQPLANDICMSCHQTGDARVFLPGKSYLDFRPGTPLSRVTAILMVPPTRENPPSDDHLEHYYSMTMSRCYLASQRNSENRQMRCITCHDPHIEPTAAQAPAFFNGKCLSCHTAQSCKASVSARQVTAPADNCIGCHMPKRDSRTISHDSLTNHRIVARPNEPFPEEAFQQTTAALPDLIQLNRAPGDSTPLQPVALLQAYSQLKEQRPEYAEPWLKTLNELEKTEPQNAIVQAALGHKALTDGQLDQATEHLREALRLDPAQPEVYSDLSAVADQQGQASHALDFARKAVTLDPWNASLRKTLVLRLIGAKQYEEAQSSMEKYLEDFPQDDFMRKMLAIAKEP